MAKRLTEYLGLTLATAGVGLVYVPAGLIVAGVLLVLVANFGLEAADDDDEDDSAAA